MSTALSASHAGDVTLVMSRGLAAGSFQRGAGITVKPVVEVQLCHPVLLVNGLLISLRLFLVKGAVVSTSKALTDTLIATRVGRE